MNKSGLKLTNFWLLTAYYLLLTTSVLANSLEDFITEKKDNVGLAYLRLGAGARGIALGSAYSSSVTGPLSTYWNPAGLIRDKSAGASFTHSIHFQGIRHEFLSISMKKNKNAYGVGAMGLFVDGIELYTETQDFIGEYRAYDTAILLSYARDLGGSLHIGATFKYIYERIYINSLHGWALDFGLSYNIKPDIPVSLVFDNVGPKQKFRIENPENIALPFIIKLGSSISFWNFLFLLEFEKPCDQVLGTNMGIEYSFLPDFFLRMGHRLMYDEEAVVKNHDTQPFTFGFGVKFNRFNLDYCYNPYKLDIGSSHIFTLSSSF